MPTSVGQWFAFGILWVLVIYVFAQMAKALSLHRPSRKWLSVLDPVTVGIVSYDLNKAETVEQIQGGFLFGFAGGQIHVTVPSDQLPAGFGVTSPQT